MAPLYILDLSNKVLNIHFDGRAAKISEVKVGGQKNLPVQLGVLVCIGPSSTYVMV